MKLNTLIKIVALCCLPAFATQAQEKHYAIVNYFQVPSGQSAEDYLAVERLRARFHQKAADHGLCRGWFLHRIEGGSGVRFAAIELHDSLDNYTKGRPASLREGLFSPEEIAKLNEADRQRDLSRSEIWEISTAAKMKRRGGNPAKLEVQFLKTKKGKDEEYRQLEEQVSRKMHQAQIDAGQTQSWVFFRRFAPAGADVEFNYITFTGYADQDGGGDDKLAPAGLNLAEQQKLRKADDLRTLVTRETWIPVLHVLPSRS